MVAGWSRTTGRKRLWLSLLVCVLFCGLGPVGPARAAGNPPWPSKCPLSIVLALDLSSSMWFDGGRVRKASDDLVDSLRDKPSRVTVIGFATQAWEVVSADDISDGGQRAAVKEGIDGVSVQNGGTNWQQALKRSGAADPDLVILVTDGAPSLYGDPAKDDSTPELSLAAAIDEADDLRSAGTRVVAVGIGLGHGVPENLPRISGPVEGDDYYLTGADRILPQLYQISSKACGVPVADLPPPEAAVFPWRPVALAVLGAILLLGSVGLVASRRGGIPARTSASPPAAARRSIGRDDVDRALGRGPSDGRG